MIGDGVYSRIVVFGLGLILLSSCRFFPLGDIDNRLPDLALAAFSGKTFYASRLDVTLLVDNVSNCRIDLKLDINNLTKPFKGTYVVDSGQVNCPVLGYGKGSVILI